jgi:hypothetical protein
MVFFVLIRVIVMMGMTLSLLVVGVLVFLMSVLVRVVVGMLVLMLVVSLLSFGLGRLGMLQSLSFFVLLLLGGKLLVCNSLVNLRIQQSILDEGSEILEDYALVVFVGASSQMSEQVSEIINWSVVLERLDAMLGMGNHVVKRVHQTRQGSTLGICGFDKAAISLHKRVDGAQLTEQVQCRDDAVMHVLLRNLHNFGLGCVVRVALDVQIHLVLQVLDFGLKCGSALDLLHESLVGFEVLALQLLFILADPVHLLLLVPDCLSLSAEEEVT